MLAQCIDSGHSSVVKHSHLGKDNYFGRPRIIVLSFMWGFTCKDPEVTVHKAGDGWISDSGLMGM